MNKTIGIICAMPEELAPLFNEFEKVETITKARMDFHKGRLKGLDTVLVVSGIGKVNAALCAQILIDDLGVTHVINTGVAGGIKKSIYPLDVVIATSLIQHDMDATAFGYALGVIPGMDTSEFKADETMLELAYTAALKNSDHRTLKGVIVTGDQFIHDIVKIKELDHIFNASACEMEGAAVAQACTLNNTPFAVIRSISDNANNGASMDYEKFKLSAVENSSRIILEMLGGFPE